MSNQGKWIWYELMSPDPAASKAFYDAVVGWTMTAGTAETNGYGFITAPDGAMIGGLLQLSRDMIDNGARPGWLGYVCVDDVDAILPAIEAAGGKVLMPAADIAMAGRVAMVSDCCGAPFYVMTPTPPPGGGESTAFAAMPNSGHCGWNELYAGDFDKALGFYTSLFGWTLPPAMDMGPMGKYQFIAQDGVQIGAIMKRPEAVPAAMWCHYFWVESIAMAKDLVAANGGQVVNGPHQVPGDLWIIQGVDPQGALFSLVGHR